MVFGKVHSNDSQVKRNSPTHHEGVHMYQRQMEDYSLPVKLELQKNTGRTLLQKLTTYNVLAHTNVQNQFGIKEVFQVG